MRKIKGHNICVGYEAIRVADETESPGAYFGWCASLLANQTPEERERNLTASFEKKSQGPRFTLHDDENS